jgi:hypothetical protein
LSGRGERRGSGDGHGDAVQEVAPGDVVLHAEIAIVG